MKFKSVFLITILSLLSLQAFAQGSSFIEVFTSDTIVLKPVSYDYEISFGGAQFMGMTLPNDDNEEMGEPPVAEIERELKRDNFIYDKVSSQTYAITGAKVYPTLVVHLSDENELSRLFDVLNEKEGVNGKILNIRHESITKYYQDSYAQLYADALQQATIMAKAMGRTIGPFVSATELNRDSLGMEDAYKNMMENMPFGLFGQQGGQAEEVIRKFAFRFVIN